MSSSTASSSNASRTEDTNTKNMDQEALDELEKQYKAHKSQFDQWKHKNKELQDTATYRQYVAQFESWEQEVEKRRELLRKAYSVPRAPDPQLSPEQSASPAPTDQTVPTANATSDDSSFLASMEPEMFMMCMMAMMMFDPMQVMMMMMGGENDQPMMEEQQLMAPPTDQPQPMSEQQHALAQAERDRALRAQRSVQSAEMGPMQQLGPEYGYGGARGIWGGHAHTYDETDPMYRKWGQRAMPPATQKTPFRPLAPGAPLPPGWVVGEPLRKNKPLSAAKDYREPKLPFRDFSMR